MLDTSKPADELKAYFVKYQDDLGNSTRLNNYLFDLFPQSKKEMRAITLCFDSGFIENGRLRNPQDIDDFVAKRVQAALTNDFGVQDELAIWAVEVWLQALGVESYQPDFFTFNNLWNSIVNGETRNALRIIRNKPDLLEYVDENEVHFAHIAAANDQIEILKTISGINPKSLLYLTKKKETTAHFASMLGKRSDCLDFILSAHPKLANLKDDNGTTAATWATANGNVEMLRIVLEKNPESTILGNYETLTVPAFIAIRKHNLDCLIALAEYYPASLKVMDDGATVAHMAALYGCIDCLDIIAKVDKNLLIARNDNGYTPKEWAEEKENFALIRRLKEVYSR